MNYTYLHCESREDWLQARRKGLGATDCSTIMGMNPYSSLYSLAVEKIHGTERDESMALDCRRNVQNEVLKAAEKLFPEHCLFPEPDERIRVNDDRPWQFASLDGYCEENVEYYNPGVVEIKTAFGFGQKAWKDGEIPDYVLWQVQHQLAVTGFEYALIVVWDGWSKFITHTVERDEELISLLNEAEEKFWNTYIVPGVLPEPDGSDATTEAIKALYPRHRPNYTIELPETFIELDAERLSWKALEKKAQENIRRIDNEIKAFMGDAECAVCGDFQYTLKTVDKKEYTVKASSSRVLRRSDKKENE